MQKVYQIVSILLVISFLIINSFCSLPLGLLKSDNSLPTETSEINLSESLTAVGNRIALPTSEGTALEGRVISSTGGNIGDGLDITGNNERDILLLSSSLAAKYSFSNKASHGENAEEQSPLKFHFAGEPEDKAYYFVADGEDAAISVSPSGDNAVVAFVLEGGSIQGLDTSGNGEVDEPTLEGATPAFIGGELPSVKEIISFSFELEDNETLLKSATGQITDFNIIVFVPFGTFVGNLTTNINFAGASLNPESGNAADFSNPFTYIVTAENETTQEYIVSVRQDVTSCIASVENSNGEDGEEENQTGATCFVPEFNDNLDGTISDSANDLMWTKCSFAADNLLINGTDFDCAGSNAKYNWEDSVSTCSSLDFAGRNDWVVPDISQLKTLVNLDAPIAPYIDTEFFPSSTASDYWSSTLFFDNPDWGAFRVNFGGGNYSYGNKIGLKYLRCITLLSPLQEDTQSSDDTENSEI